MKDTKDRRILIKTFALVVCGERSRTMSLVVKIHCITRYFKILRANSPAGSRQLMITSSP